MHIEKTVALVIDRDLTPVLDLVSRTLSQEGLTRHSVKHKDVVCEVRNRVEGLITEAFTLGLEEGNKKS
jgi:hypothetical protein